MFLRLFVIAGSVFTVACGALLGQAKVDRHRNEVVLQSGLSEIVEANFSIAATGVFFPDSVTASLTGRVTPVAVCRGYALVEVTEASVARREIDTPGLALDLGLLVGGLIVSSFGDSPAQSGAVALTALVPIGIDGFYYWRRSPQPVTRVTEKRPREGARFACPPKHTAPLFVKIGGDEVLVSDDHVFHAELSPEDLRRQDAGETLRLEIGVGARVQAADVVLGPSYAAFVSAYTAVTRRPTLTGLADFIHRYPMGADRQNLVLRFERLVMDTLDAEVLRDAAALPNLDPEMRRIAQKRYRTLRQLALAEAVPERIVEAVRAEQAANTFFLNDMRGEGERRLVEKDEKRAEACRDLQELVARSGKGVGHWLKAWQGALAEKLDEPGTKTALHWLQLCTE